MSIKCLGLDIDGQMLPGLFWAEYMQKTWLTDWVSDWLSEIVTTREAIASNKIVFSQYFLFGRVRFDLLRGHFQHFQLLLWLKSLCYVYQMFGLRYWWPFVALVILSWIFAKTWVTDWLSDWLTNWVKLWLLERLLPLIRLYSLYIFCFVGLDLTCWGAILQHFQLLLWLKSLCYVYQMFELRDWWPNVTRVILSWIF